RAQFERFSAAFQQIDDLFAAFINGTALFDDSDAAIGVHHEDELGFGEHGNIRIVRNEDHLPAFLQSLDRVHHCLENEVIVEVILGLVDDKRAVAPRQEYGQQRGALLTAGKIRGVFEVRPSRSRDIQLDADSVFDTGYLQRQRIDALAEGIQYFPRPLRPEMRKLIERFQVVGLNELRKLLRPQVHESRNDFVLISNARALQAVDKHLLVTEMVGVAHDANSYALAGLVLELRGHFVPHGRDAIAHQDVFGLQRFSVVE